MEIDILYTDDGPLLRLTAVYDSIIIQTVGGDQLRIDTHKDCFKLLYGGVRYETKGRRIRRSWDNKERETKMTESENQTATQDNWEHRSARMLCQTCMWYVPKKPVGSVGRCRRHAPTMNGYPVVYTTDWCGDHKLNEKAASD